MSTIRKTSLLEHFTFSNKPFSLCLTWFSPICDRVFSHSTEGSLSKSFSFVKKGLTEEILIGSDYDMLTKIAIMLLESCVYSKALRYGYYTREHEHRNIKYDDIDELSLYLEFELNTIYRNSSRKGNKGKM